MGFPGAILISCEGVPAGLGKWQSIWADPQPQTRPVKILGQWRNRGSGSQRWENSYLSVGRSQDQGDQLLAGGVVPADWDTQWGTGSH
jgi:hypothetical protein